MIVIMFPEVRIIHTVSVSSDILSYFTVFILDHCYKDRCGNKYTSPGNFPVCHIPGDETWWLPIFFYLLKNIKTMYAIFHVWFAE